MKTFLLTHMKTVHNLLKCLGYLIEALKFKSMMRAVTNRCYPSYSILNDLNSFLHSGHRQQWIGGKAKCGVILEPTTQSKMFKRPDDIILSPGSAQLRLNVDSKSDILFPSELPRLSSGPMCGELRQTVESIWSDRVI